MTLEDKRESVKTAAATKMFWDDVKVYGSKGQALRALDCYTVEEAIEMLKEVIALSVFKINGEVVVQQKPFSCIGSR